MKRRLLFAPFFAALVWSIPAATFAHCPLCTIGAGAAAGLAVWLGISTTIVGVFIGAFGFALGLWMGRLIKKQYFKGQSLALGILSFALTVFPLEPLFTSYTSLYISWGGAYGSLFNRTYVIERFLFGSILGALLVCAAPSISRFVTRARKGRQVPFQGLAITFLLLIGVSLIIQFLP